MYALIICSNPLTLCAATLTSECRSNNVSRLGRMLLIHQPELALATEYRRRQAASGMPLAPMSPSVPVCKGAPSATPPLLADARAYRILPALLITGQQLDLDRLSRERPADSRAFRLRPAYFCHTHWRRMSGDWHRGSPCGPWAIRDAGMWDSPGGAP